MPSVVANCDTSSSGPGAATTEPSTIVIACADGGVSFGGLTWSSWGATSATGQGQLSQNDCTPACADGTFHQYDAAVTLSRVVNSINGPVFSVIDATYPSGGPDGQASGTFSLPLPPQPSPTCRASQVQPWVSQEQTEGAFSDLFIRLTDVSSQPCHMDGFPGFDLLDGSGTSIVNAGRSCAWASELCEATPNAYVSLGAHGGEAWFQLVWRSVPEPGGTCPESASALVTPPDAFDHLTLPLDLAVCGEPPELGLSTVWS